MKKENNYINNINSRNRLLANIPKEPTLTMSMIRADFIKKLSKNKKLINVSTKLLPPDRKLLINIIKSIKQLLDLGRGLNMKANYSNKIYKDAITNNGLLLKYNAKINTKETTLLLNFLQNIKSKLEPSMSKTKFFMPHVMICYELFNNKLQNKMLLDLKYKDKNYYIYITSLNGELLQEVKFSNNVHENIHSFYEFIFQLAHVLCDNNLINKI